MSNGRITRRTAHQVTLAIECSKPLRPTEAAALVHGWLKAHLPRTPFPSLVTFKVLSVKPSQVHKKIKRKG